MVQQFDDAEQQTIITPARAGKTELKLNVTVPAGRVITISDGVREKTYQPIPLGKRAQVSISAIVEDVP